MTASTETLLAEALRANGFKITRARQAVIHALSRAAKPLSINDLHDSARDYAEDIGLVTVYRTLELLISLDLVRPVHLMENCHGYALATPGHTHHVICQRCNRAIEITGCDLSAFLDEITAHTGYRITGHWLEIEGLCPDCQTTGE
ncbi:MAG: transcriptional repressor [Anaerolineae bacterium]